MPETDVTVLCRRAELASYATGAVLACFFLAQLALGEIERRADVAIFEDAAQGGGLDLSGTGDPDTSLWAPGRVADYRASLAAEPPEILGVLEIDSLGLKVPVYATNSALAMDRGAGVIDGTAYPHEAGNIGISGHRDGYFRVLKDIAAGDRLRLQTLEGDKHFRVAETRIVEVTDTSLLEDTEEQTLTLVTCYPFYYVGHAPQRFIVRAVPDTTYVNRN